MERLKRINCYFHFLFSQKDNVQKLDEDFDGPLKQRNCTDILCLILFISYIGGLVRKMYEYDTNLTALRRYICKLAQYYVSWFWVSKSYVQICHENWLTICWLIRNLYLTGVLVHLWSDIWRPVPTSLWIRCLWGCLWTTQWQIWKGGRPLQWERLIKPKVK